jgi:hypothetical protein
MLPTATVETELDDTPPIGPDVENAIGEPSLPAGSIDDEESPAINSAGPSFW